MRPPCPFIPTHWKVTITPSDDDPARKFWARRPRCWHFPGLCACRRFRNLQAAIDYAYRAASLGL